MEYKVVNMLIWADLWRVN